MDLGEHGRRWEEHTRPLPCNRYCMSHVSDSEIKTPRAAPITMETTSRPSNNDAPSLGLAGAAPFDSFSKVGATLSLRSEGAVISTTVTGESRGSTQRAALRP